MKNLKLVMLLMIAFIGSSSLLTAQENDKKVKKKIVIVKKEINKDGTVTEERIVKEGKEADEYIKQNDMNIDIERDEKTQEIRVKVTTDDEKKGKKKKGEKVEKEIRVRVKANDSEGGNVEIIEIEEGDGQQIKKKIKKGQHIIIEKNGEEVEEIIIKRSGNDDRKALFIEKNVDIQADEDGKIVIRTEENGKVKVIKLDGDDIDFDDIEELKGMGGVEMLHLVGDDDRGFLGVQIATEDEGKGVIIKDVYEKSAAKEAGLQKIDIITAVDGQKVVTVKELTKALKGKQAGDKVKIDYLRQGKAQSATVTLKEGGNNKFKWKSDDGKNIFFSKDDDFLFEGASDRPMLGIMIDDSEVEKGVKLSGVIKKSGAEKAGLKEGDVLTSIDGKAVNSVKEIFNALEEKKADDTVKITYLRDGKEQRADLKLGKSENKMRFKIDDDDEQIIIIEEKKEKN